MKDVISIDEGKKFYDLLSTKKFYIPIYQREYQWRAPQIDRLMLDYIEACDKGNAAHEHFIGSLLYQQGDDIDGRYILVDGQQRTTSLFLMYIAILLAGFKTGFSCENKAKRLEYFIKWATIPEKFGVGKTTFAEHIKYASELEQIRFHDLLEKLDEVLVTIHESNGAWIPKILQLTDEQVKEYSLLIDKTISDLIKTQKSKKSENNNFIGNFVLMYKGFLKEVNEGTEVDPIYNLDTMYNFLQFEDVSILFVPIKIEDEIHAIPVFNEINTTGVPLNDAELIRSYLICQDQVYTNVLDYIEIEIRKFVEAKFKKSDEDKKKEHISSIYEEFMLAVIEACKNRAGVKKYRKKFEGDIEDKSKIANPLYENFKQAYDFLKLNKDPENFALLLSRYFDYFKLFKKLDDKDRTKHRLFRDLELNSRVSQKLALIIESFDHKLLNTYMGDVLVLFERVDPNVNMGSDKELQKLDFKTFFKVLHALWAFVIRAKVNSEYYYYKKVSNTTIDISVCDSKKIFTNLLIRLDEQKPKVSEEIVIDFKESLLKNDKIKKDSLINYLLRIIDLSLKFNIQSDFKKICAVVPKEKSIKQEWKKTLCSTTAQNWGKLRRYSISPEKLYIDINDPNLIDIVDKLNALLQPKLGNYILVNSSSAKDIDSKDNFIDKKAAFIYDRSTDDVINLLNSKTEWGFADIIELSDLYAEHLFKVLAFESEVFFNDSEI